MGGRKRARLKRLYKKITGQCCPRCTEPLAGRLIARLLGNNDEPPETVTCTSCGARLKAKGNRFRQFFVVFLVYFVPAALLAAIWSEWAAALILPLVPFMPAIVGIEEKLR